MTKDDVAQKLVLLPEGMVERNLASWEKQVEFFRSFADSSLFELLPESFIGSAQKKIFELVRELSMSEHAKLFRAGQSVYDLMISTADRHGLKAGEHFVRVSFERKSIVIQYEIAGPLTDGVNRNISERTYCSAEDNLMLKLQPFLDRLWNETRGKKNA